MNRAQRLLLDTYERGEYRGWTAEDFARTEDTGDPLIDFLFRELSDKQFGDTLEVALSRMDVIADEINDVYGAIAHAYMTEDTE